MRKATLVMIAGLLLGLNAVAQAETQTFDSEASASAAGWTEFKSRPADGDFDFGFSLTNNAEGASGEGEGGGLLARSTPIGYYVDKTIGGRSDLNIDLHATGRIKFQDINFDGEFQFGWVDAAKGETNGKDDLGFRVQEPRNGLWRVKASIDGTSGSNQLDIPDDTALDFEIEWDADGGAAVGDGKVTVTFTRLDGTEAWVSSREGFDGMNFDAFGLMSNSQSPHDPLDVSNFWFDDLEYTVIPEPGSIAFFLSGLLALALFAWRRRK